MKEMIKPKNNARRERFVKSSKNTTAVNRINN